MHRCSHEPRTNYIEITVITPDSRGTLLLAQCDACHASYLAAIDAGREQHHRQNHRFVPVPPCLHKDQRKRRIADELAGIE